MKGKRVHFVGIAGMGMSAVAILLKEQGWEVSGSDAEAYPPATTQLERHKIPYNTSYNAKNILHDADVIVIGKNAKLTREENEEVRAGYESGARIVSFPELLGEIVKERETIVVAGSYGKSTITSLLAWCLSHAGIDAGWFIGASPEGMEPAHLGTHPVFVLEGDEYPTSHEDLKPKFLHYHARDVLITAATHDHVNVYPTHDDYLKPFRTLLKSLPSNGLLVLSADERHARTMVDTSSARLVWYALNDESGWYARNIRYGDTTVFTLMKDGNSIIELETQLMGAHNVENIVGVAAALLEKKLVTPKQLAAALKHFKGLTRRLDKKTSNSSVPAYEGFGSSREKLQAAINALKAQYPEKRLILVFEPHTFSWRNKQMLHWFDTGFGGAELVVLYKPAEQGADTHEQSTQEEMVRRLSEVGIIARPTNTPEETLSVLSSEVRDGDLVLLSSSGSMDGLIEQIPQWLDTMFVNK